MQGESADSKVDLDQKIERMKFIFGTALSPDILLIIWLIYLIFQGVNLLTIVVGVAIWAFICFLILKIMYRVLAIGFFHSHRILGVAFCGLAGLIHFMTGFLMYSLTTSFLSIIPLFIGLMLFPCFLMAGMYWMGAVVGYIQTRKGDWPKNDN